MKALLTWYSFTGQTERAVGLAAQALREAGFEVTSCRIDFADPALRLKRPMSIGEVKRWTKAAEKGETFPVVLDPPQALSDRYDFIGIFSNTWQSHPATPVRSLLAMPEMKAALNGTAFAVYAICRRLWKRNIEIVCSEAAAAGGLRVGSEAFIHHGGQIGSLIRTVSYLLSSGSAIAKLGSLRLPLPAFGLSDAALERLPAFTREVAAASQQRSEHSKGRPQS